MKTPFLAMVFLGVLPFMRAAENDRLPRGRAALAQTLRQDFRYSPRAELPAETGEPGAQVVLMERVLVAELDLSRGVKERIDADREKREAARFSFAKGGALLSKEFGRIRIEFGARGDASGLTLLRIKW